MIHVDEITTPFSNPNDHNLSEEVQVIDSPEEEAQLVFLDAELESISQKMSGDMFDVVFSDKLVSLKIVSALKRMWEAGGWIVQVFKRNESHYQMVFAKPKLVRPSTVKDKKIEVTKKESISSASDVITNAAPKMSNDLLLRMPTRGRPEQALKVIAEYRRLARHPHPFEIVIDEDDEATNNSQVLQAFCDLDCVITVGKHKNKIDAVNAGRVDDFKILALVSDDMMPVRYGYDQEIIEAMKKHFPLYDGAIYFNDGYNKDHVREGQTILCTLPIMGRHLLDQFGYVYYPEYGSLYSDDEQTNLLTQMNRLTFIDDVIIEHRHHAAGKAPYDELYQFNDKSYGRRDALLCKERSEMRQADSQFTYDAPPMWLSILVCSTFKRESYLRRLCEYLRHQMRPYRKEVEIVVSIDNGELSIGEKREKLLKRAVGHFVAFIDDDDWVDSKYVARVVTAIKEYPNADCTSLSGVITSDGKSPEVFLHSLKYDGWYTRNQVHYRTPNHLNAIRKEHALKVGFPSKNFGEDHDFSKAVLPYLKKEAPTGDKPLYYYWYRSKKEEGLS